MNKRIAVLFSMIILSATLYGEIELGLSYTPGTVLKSDANVSRAKLEDQDAMGDSILGFHVGYSFWWLFYVSLDSLIVPPWFVEQESSYTDLNNDYHPGTRAPGFMNFIDFGVRPKIGPIYALATMGINNLYIHSEYETGNEETTLGVNLRLGFGVQFGALSISVTGTKVFSSFEAMDASLTRMSDGDTQAEQEFWQSLIPSIGFVLHLE